MREALVTVRMVFAYETLRCYVFKGPSGTGLVTHSIYLEKELFQGTPPPAVTVRVSL